MNSVHILPYWIPNHLNINGLAVEHGIGHIAIPIMQVI